MQVCHPDMPHNASQSYLWHNHSSVMMNFALHVLQSRIVVWKRGFPATSEELCMKYMEIQCRATLRLSGIVLGKKWVISHLMLVLSNGWSKSRSYYVSYGYSEPLKIGPLLTVPYILKTRVEICLCKFALGWGKLDNLAENPLFHTTKDHCDQVTYTWNFLKLAVLIAKLTDRGSSFIFCDMRQTCSTSPAMQCAILSWYLWSQQT